MTKIGEITARVYPIFMGGGLDKFFHNQFDGEAVVIKDIDVGVDTLGAHFDVRQALSCFFAAILTSVPVVVDHHLEVVSLVDQTNIDAAGIGVFGDIIDGLLVNEIEVLSDVHGNFSALVYFVDPEVIGNVEFE